MISVVRYPVGLEKRPPGSVCFVTGFLLFYCYFLVFVVSEVVGIRQFLLSAD